MVETIENINTPAFYIREEMIGEAFMREALLDKVMGKQRFRKSSEKLRRGYLPSAGLALVAVHPVDERILATIRLWDIVAGLDSSGQPVKALLLGPLAVDLDFKNRGLGAALMTHAIEKAAILGHGAILLVGDPQYYQRFGFSADKTALLSMPGPYEQHRFLSLELIADYLGGAKGILKPAGKKTPVIIHSIRMKKAV